MSEEDLQAQLTRLKDENGRLDAVPHTNDPGEEAPPGSPGGKWWERSWVERI